MTRSLAAKVLVTSLLVACGSREGDEPPRYPEGFNPSLQGCLGKGPRFTSVSGDNQVVTDWLVFVGGDVTVEAARLVSEYGGEVGGIYTWSSILDRDAFLVLDLAQWDAMRMSMDPAVCWIEPNELFSGGP